MIVNSKIAFFAKNFSLRFFVLQSCDICVIIMSQHIQEGANMNTGARIKARRQELGLSVDELADKLGKNRATIYRYESNDIENMPAKVLGPLSDALETTPGYLMGWTDDPYNYDLDPDSRFSVVPTAWIDAWQSEGLSSKEMWERYQSVENDWYEPSDTDQDELTEYLEVLRSRPECRMLFSLAKDATKADVEKAVAIIEALRGIGDK